MEQASGDSIGIVPDPAGAGPDPEDEQIKEISITTWEEVVSYCLAGNEVDLLLGDMTIEIHNNPDASFLGFTQGNRIALNYATIHGAYEQMQMVVEGAGIPIGEEGFLVKCIVEQERFSHDHPGSSERDSETSSVASHGEMYLAMRFPQTVLYYSNPGVFQNYIASLEHAHNSTTAAGYKHQFEKYFKMFDTLDPAGHLRKAGGLSDATDTSLYLEQLRAFLETHPDFLTKWEGLVLAGGK